MHIIWMGVLLAIGFYIAPAVLSVIGLVVVGVVGIIASIFNGGK